MASTIEKGAPTILFERKDSSILHPASVLDLPEKLGKLDEKDRLLVQSLFEINISKKGDGSRLKIPETMRPLILKTFGNGKSPEETIEEVEDQQLVRIQDRHFKSEAVFNPLRRKRPQPTSLESAFQRDLADPKKREECPFCRPEENTPSDSQLGRLSKGAAIAVVNLTKFSDEHTVVFGRHNPYEIEEGEFVDQMDLLLEWANKKSNLNPDIKFARFGLNFGYRAAASREHGHHQGELRTGSMHFPYAERLNEIAFLYKSCHKGNFFTDLFKAHKALGLGIKVGEASVMSMLVPLKEHGVMIVDENVGSSKEFFMSEDFQKALWEVQQFMMKEEKVREYNLFILPRPKNPQCESYWDDYRTTAFFVDRGDPTSRNSDWGYAELSHTSVISYDPFDFGPRLNAHLLAPHN